MNIKKFIIHKIKNIKKTDKPKIIGIDGPTAAGKTFLSKELKLLLKKDFKTIWICQLDWTLKSRAYRTNSLKLFKNENTNIILGVMMVVTCFIPGFPWHWFLLLAIMFFLFLGSIGKDTNFIYFQF